MASIQRIEGKTSVSYKIVCDLGRDQNGKRVRRTMTYVPDEGMTQRKAEKAAEKAAAQFEQKITQGYVVDNRQTFAEFAEYVLRLKEREGLKRSTLDRYRELLTRINAAIGHLRLVDIRPAHLNQFYENLSGQGIRRDEKATPSVDFNDLLRERRMKKKELSERAGLAPITVNQVCRGNTVSMSTAVSIAAALGEKVGKFFAINKADAPLSRKTVVEHHRLISAILAQAEKEMIVPYNSASKASPPRVEDREPNYFQPDQICAILDALETEPLKWQAIVNLMMITGCRRGEIMGLKWNRIDFEEKRIKIDTARLSSSSCPNYEDSTKTRNVRYIPLPDETLALLRRHRAAQNELRLANGDRWQDNGYVFTQDNGAPMNPDSPTGWLSEFSKRHGLPHINPHAFRHSAASVLIAKGTDIVTVSKMLGHAKVTTTENLYAHVIEESKQQAGNALADAYFHGRKAAN